MKFSTGTKASQECSCIKWNQVCIYRHEEKKNQRFSGTIILLNFYLVLQKTFIKQAKPSRTHVIPILANTSSHWNDLP